MRLTNNSGQGYESLSDLHRLQISQTRNVDELIGTNRNHYQGFY